MSKREPTSEQQGFITVSPTSDVLVVAGAGSGKTTTMTDRIVYLIGHGVPAERILGLTFTNKAAGELRERVAVTVAQATGNNAESMFLKPTISTYDAFFRSLVEQYGLLVGFDQNTQLISTAGATELAVQAASLHMDELIDVFSSLDYSDNGVVALTLSLSNAIGNAMIGGKCSSYDEAIARIRTWDQAFIERLTQEIEGKLPDENTPARSPEQKCAKRCAELLTVAQKRELLLTLVEEFVHLKRERNMAEFSDYTIAAYQLVTRFPSIARRYRERFSHVLLDEYQDTSTTQAVLLAAIFHNSLEGTDIVSSVNAVGDPFQSIYSFRGASPGAFRIFQQDFGLPSDYEPLALTITWRNPRVVLDAANNLTVPLRMTPNRPSSSTVREVDVHPLQTRTGVDEGTLGVLGYDTSAQEIDGVTRFALAAKKRFCDNCSDADHNVADSNHKAHVAVLCRTKSAIPGIRQSLEDHGLIVHTVGYSALLERPEVKDVVALLSAVADHTNAKALLRMLSTPRYHVGAADLSVLANLADGLNTEQRFLALVQAGLADTETPKSERASVVRQYRDRVANGVFLIDMLTRSDVDKIINGRDDLSDEGKRAILSAAQVMRKVRRNLGLPLVDLVRCAIEALDLDIDTVVAQAVNGVTVNPTVARMPLENIIDLASTYMQEVSSATSPSLQGFVQWLHQLASSDATDEAANMSEGGADVEIMTIHQAKGLEWDAVAVVNMAKGKFPSNTGDGLKVEEDKDHVGGFEQGLWVAPQYEETSRTWLDDPAAVPVPMRVDADILPKFPHDATSDSVAALAALDSVKRIANEASGTARDDTEDDDTESPYLTQAEEYGRRFHADERRLAYVAVTRARHDVLLTYAKYESDSRDASQVKRVKAEEDDEFYKASNFFKEVHDSMKHDREVCAAREISETVLDTPLPQGYFVGERAGEYLDDVVRSAWNESLDDNQEMVSMQWPANLSDDISQRLTQGIALVQQYQDDENLPETLEQGSLFAYAMMLADDDDLMPHDVIDDELIKQKALRIQANTAQSVTNIQVRAGLKNKRDEQQYYRSQLRPIPRVSSAAAEAGTRFHAWAELFLKAQYEPEITVPEVGENGADIVPWQHHLMESRWAERTPVWAELPLALKQTSVKTLVGKIDAVFEGGLNPNDSSKRYTVVDWKTGKRPTKAADIDGKLFQLDCYRLMLAKQVGCDLDAIDACLYYVGEDDESKRQINAKGYSEQEILDELSKNGIPDLANDD